MKDSNRKLVLNKQVVANLHNDDLHKMVGGQSGETYQCITNDGCQSVFLTHCGQCTDGCTDGCWIFHSWGNCTKTNCTADCVQR